MSRDPAPNAEMEVVHCSFILMFYDDFLYTFVSMKIFFIHVSGILMKTTTTFILELRYKGVIQDFRDNLWYFHDSDVKPSLLLS